MKRKYSIIGMSIVVLLALLYAGVSMYYQTRFLPHTYVGTVEISGSNVEEANRKLAKNLHAQTFTLSEGNEELAAFTASDLQANMEAKLFLQKAKAEQGSWNWPGHLFSEKRISNQGTGIAYDERELDKLIAALPLAKEDRTDSQNATVVREEGRFIIRPEVQGTEVDQDALKQAILKAMEGNVAKIKVEDHYVQPTLTQEDPDLQDTVAKLSELSETVVTYRFSGIEETVPQELIASWLTVDKDGNPDVDLKAAQGYLKTLNEKHSTHQKERTFETTSRGTMTVPAGTYGWSIATETEAENLREYLLAGEDVTVQPTINGSGYHEDGTDIGSSYIEVDIENQMMYLYKNGEKKLETNIVSGHPETASPVGVFYAWNKVEDTFLIGYNPRREADYETPVNYWVPIDWEGIGIHDADWQTSFASKEYLTNGSNGCINTPPGVMDDFFAEIEIGMPVIIL